MQGQGGDGCRLDHRFTSGYDNLLSFMTSISLRFDSDMTDWGWLKGEERMKSQARGNLNRRNFRRNEEEEATLKAWVGETSASLSISHPAARCPMYLRLRT
jgi:hypothetical protein